MEKIALYGLDACFGVRQRREALSQTEILILSVRLNEHTRGLIDASVFSELRAGAFLVNAARDALVDYRSLCAAMRSGRLAGLGLDVHWQEPFPLDDPLIRMHNVIATSHVAGVTDRSYGDIAAAVASNIECLRRGDPLANRAA